MAGSAGKRRAWKPDVAKKELLHIPFHTCADKERCAGWKGAHPAEWDAQDTLFSHRQNPWAWDPLLRWKSGVTPLTIRSNSARSASGMNTVSERVQAASAARNPAAQSLWISSVSQRGINLGVQMCLSNPRLRHLIAVLIQRLYRRARSAAFQTLNFPWNRCEKQRERSDPGFCFTSRTETVSHVPPLLWHWCSSSFLLAWTLQIPVTSLPDTTFHLAMHRMEIALSCHRAQEISFSLHQTPAPNSGWGICP